MIPQNYEILVKVKTDQEFLKETKPQYCVLRSRASEIHIPDMKLENVDKVLKFHVENSSLSSIKLTLPVPCISKSCFEIKIKLNFYFHTSLWCLKRFCCGR